MASRFGIVTQTGLADGIVSYLKDRPTVKAIMKAVIAISISLGGVAYMGGDLTGTAMGVSTISGIPSNIVAAVWGCCILIIINISNDILGTLMKLIG